MTSLSLGGYFHRNRGRGDWLPPYIADVTDNGGGPESKLMGGTPVPGGSQLGLIRFVNPNGAAVGPMPGCASSYIFNYYGSGGPAVDTACHPGATAVQSYRHSHYGKDRAGVTLDEEWFAPLGAAGSTLRAGPPTPSPADDTRSGAPSAWRRHHRCVKPARPRAGEPNPA